jgi:hypothetical protein
MLTANVNGIKCVLFYEERIIPEKAPSGFPFMYHIRHDENDWTCPISIEKYVAVNFFGTVFMEKPLEFDSSSYIKIKKFKLESNYIKFKVSKSLFMKMLSF